ncbi:hypothetical protein HOY80DRAFT_949330 [Tuber brumale]|nr:hypothetical protein HOY80DRAFT_949330 [Tuber brumale]
MRSMDCKLGCARRRAWGADGLRVVPEPIAWSPGLWDFFFPFLSRAAFPPPPYYRKGTVPLLFFSCLPAFLLACLLA